ncbi:MAG: RNase P subunit p30 family protein [Candidatus Nanosalina sp.]
MDYFDLCIEKPSEDVVSKAEQLGWQNPSNYRTVILQSDDWGKLKRKIRQEREENHVVVVKGGKEEINRKSVSDPRVDILLHPGKGRKDSGLDKGIVETAAEENVALGLDFSRTQTHTKEKVHLFTEWRKNLRYSKKYGMKYSITTKADEKTDLRAPRDLQALIDSLGFSGKEAFNTSQKIIRKNTEKLDAELEKGGVNEA